MSDPAWFDVNYYLRQKANELNNSGTDNHIVWTAQIVQAAFDAAGLSAYQHYQQYGINESINPNQYFDQAYYLSAKAAELNAAAGNTTTWTPALVLTAIENAGLTPYEHFSEYGVNEGLNPSSSFDVQAYLQSKATEMNQSGGTTTWTPSTVLDALQSAGLDPITHYIEYGSSEGITVTPVESGGDSSTGGGGGGSATFTVTEGTGADVGKWTISTGNGTVTVTVDGTNYVFTPTTGTAVTVAQAEVTSLVVDTITLRGASGILNGLTITGTGTVAVEDLQATAAADLSHLTTTSVTAAVDGNVTFTGNLGSAVVTVAATKTLTAAASVVDGVTINGSYGGDVHVTDVHDTSATDLSKINNSINSLLLVGTTGDDTIDASALSKQGVSIQGGQGKDIMTAGSGSDKFIFTAGDSTDVATSCDSITGLAAGDKITLSAISTSFNLITSETATTMAGANITLGTNGFDAFTGTVGGTTYLFYETTAGSGTTLGTLEAVALVGGTPGTLTNWSASGGVITIA